MKKLLIFGFVVVCLGIAQIAYATPPQIPPYDINVVLDQYSFDPTHNPYPYFYHYTVTNLSISTPDLSHWSLFIPCMHSGSTDLSSINNPLGFTHEAPTFKEPGDETLYYGIKWEGSIAPGSSVTSFGFYSSLSQGTVEWKSKGGQAWDQGVVGGPAHGVIPEPATMSLLGMGLLGLVGIKKEKGAEMKFLVSSLLLSLALIVTSTAQASPVVFSETFLGEAYDNDWFQLTPNYRAWFYFDLTGTGGSAYLYNNSFAQQDFRSLATDDELDFDPSIHTPLSAELKFVLSATDETVNELVRVRIATPGDDNSYVTLYEQIHQIGGPGHEEREYEWLTVPINAPYLSYLNDGKTLGIVVAPASSSFTNNFRIDQAQLCVTASAVPEPASLSLLGMGLLGLMGMRKRRA